MCHWGICFLRRISERTGVHSQQWELLIFFSSRKYTVKCARPPYVMFFPFFLCRVIITYFGRMDSIWWWWEKGSPDAYRKKEKPAFYTGKNYTTKKLLYIKHKIWYIAVVHGKATVCVCVRSTYTSDSWYLWSNINHFNIDTCSGFFSSLLSSSEVWIIDRNISEKQAICTFVVFLPKCFYVTTYATYGSTTL